MGTIQNDAIIVTGFTESIHNAHKKAKEIFNAKFSDYYFKNLVSDLMPQITNGDFTFIVIPDGSKEGWDLSDEFDIRRKKFIEYLHKQECLTFVHVSYGEIEFSIPDHKKHDEEYEERTV